MKDKFMVLGVVLALVLSFFGVSKDKTVVVDSNNQPVGALTSPDLSSRYFSFGGVRSWASRKSLEAATTTVCALQSPNATSSLVRTGLNVTTGTSTAGTITMATSSSPFATTTSLESFTIASGAQGNRYYIPTTSANSVMAPNTYVVFGVAGVPYGFTYEGTCQATWEQL